MTAEQPATRRATLDSLTTPRLEQAEVELSDGCTVLIRALTRAEVGDTREDNTDARGEVDEARQEYDLIALSIMDPPMSADEVAKWARVAPAGDLVAVMDAVVHLSGLDEAAQKSGLPGNRQHRRAAVRARAGKGSRRHDR